MTSSVLYLRADVRRAGNITENKINSKNVLRAHLYRGRCWGDVEGAALLQGDGLCYLKFNMTVCKRAWR